MGKGYLGRSKQIDRAPLASNLENDDAESPSITPVYSLWLGTGEEGMYKVAISDIATELAVSESRVRSLAKKRKLILKNEGRNHAWHYDKDADTISFVANKYDSFFTDQNAFQFALSVEVQT